MSRRTRRDAIETIERESAALQRRLRDAEYRAALTFRDVPGIAVITPSELIAAFIIDSDYAYRQLAQLSESQLICQAIDTASYLELELGTIVPWAYCLQRWKMGIARVGDCTGK